MEIYMARDKLKDRIPKEPGEDEKMYNKRIMNIEYYEYRKSKPRISDKNINSVSDEEFIPGNYRIQKIQPRESQQN